MPRSPQDFTPVPFWNRLREVTLYPFRGSVAVTLVVLTLCGLLGYLPGIGWFLSLVILFSAYKFAFEILRSSADGHTEAPENLLSVDNGTIWRYLGLHFVLLVIVIVALGSGGVVIGLLTLVLVVFLQPGMTMSLAIDGDFGRAIDPSTALAIVGRIGGPYFAAFGLLFVIQASAATAGSWLAQFMPGVLGKLALDLFFYWGLFAAFHLMGYLVYQYHEALGYAPSRHARALPTLQSRDQALLDAAEAHVHDGNNAAAMQRLDEEIRTRAVTPEVHELYRRLLRSSADAAAIEKHAALYLNLLMLEKQERKALGLLRESLTANPDFVPLQVEHGDQLAQRAKTLGQAQLALDQWQALLRRHPKDVCAPRWALDAALTMVERFGRDAEARTLLESARSRCEEPALLDKIDALLASLPTR